MRENCDHMTRYSLLMVGYLIFKQFGREALEMEDYTTQIGHKNIHISPLSSTESLSSGVASHPI